MRRRLAVLSVLLIACANAFDTTIGLSNICPAHHVTMEKRAVYVVDGRQGVEELIIIARALGSLKSYLKDEQSLFPFARTNIGWSDTDPKAPSTGVLYVCPECVAARETWLKEKGLTSRQSQRSPSVLFR